MEEKDTKTKKVDPKKLAKDKEVKKDEYFEQPPSDSDEDICGPLNCDKELSLDQAIDLREELKALLTRLDNKTDNII